MTTIRTLTYADLIRGVATKPTSRKLGHPEPARECVCLRAPIAFERGHCGKCGKDAETLKVAA